MFEKLTIKAKQRVIKNTPSRAIYRLYFVLGKTGDFLGEFKYKKFKDLTIFVTKFSKGNYCIFCSSNFLHLREEQASVLYKIFTDPFSVKKRI